MNNINLTEEQKQILGIKDERVDFYFKVENEVIDNPEIFKTDREFIVFIVLSRYCNNNNVAYPSLETLAKKSRCTKRNVIIALNGLVEKGLIKKINRYEQNTKTYQTNLYAIQTLKKYVAVDENTNDTRGDVANDTKGGVANDTRGGVANDTRGGVANDTRVVSPATPNKELFIKNNIKNTTTTNNISNDNNINNSSSNSNFLNFLEKYDINNMTRKNIIKHFPNLTENEFIKIYMRKIFT